MSQILQKSNDPHRPTDVSPRIHKTNGQTDQPLEAWVCLLPTSVRKPSFGTPASSTALCMSRAVCRVRRLVHPVRWGPCRTNLPGLRVKDVRIGSDYCASCLQDAREARSKGRCAARTHLRPVQQCALITVPSRHRTRRVAG